MRQNIKYIVIVLFSKDYGGKELSSYLFFLTQHFTLRPNFFGNQGCMMGRQMQQDLLHSSVIEGSKPNGGRDKMYRDHHLPILFEGPLKPLEQTDGLVLQGVNLCSIKSSFLFLDFLGLRC